MSIASSIVDGFGVGVLWGIVAAFILTVVNTVVTSLLGIDDDFYYRNVIQRAAARQGATSSDVPGVVFLEIDGLAHEVVVRATQRQHADGGPMAARRNAPSHPVGRRTGHRRRVHARQDCCTATATIGPRFAGGRRSTSDRSSRTIPRTPPSWSVVIRTDAACCTKTAPAGRTSSRATRNTAC